MLSNCGAGEDSWESLGQQGDQTSPSQKRSTLNVHWKGWCWSWNSNTLATWCEEQTHWKRPWFWERLKAGGEADDRGWVGWMRSTTQWIWVWANSGRWWRTEKPSVRQSMGAQSDWKSRKQHPLLLVLISENTRKYSKKAEWWKVMPQMDLLHIFKGMKCKYCIVR